jgi:hypothetical protein
MNRTDATKLARRLLDQHGLVNWKLRLYTLENGTFGKVNTDQKVLYINGLHIDTHPDYEIKDTILHEIAHALTADENEPHGPKWFAKAKEIGARPEVCSRIAFNPLHIDAVRSGSIVEVEVEEEIVYKPKYTIHQLKDLCPTCGKVAKELGNVDTTEKINDKLEDIKLTVLSCGHIIKRIIPKLTPFHNLITQGQGDLNCKHDWSNPDKPTECTICGAFKLYPFQVDGCHALEKGAALGKGLGIFDDMGLGKTVMPLGYLHFHPEKFPFLWIGKAGIKYQYFKEILRWLGPKHFPQVINTANDALLPGLSGYIISYAALRKFDLEKFKKIGIKTVILDECQAVKNPDSTQTQMTRDLVNQVETVIPTSGTPWKNRGNEYFVVLNMLDAKKFYSYKQFIDDWVDEYYEGNKKKMGGIKNPAKFKEYIKDIAIRREREVVMPQLPKVNRTKFYCKVPDHAKSAYSNEEKNIVSIMNNAILEGRDANFEEQARINRSIIIMRRIVGVAKVPATLDYVEQFLEESDRKLVVFVHHKDCAAMLHAGMKELIDKYDGDDKPELFVLSADNSSIERTEIQNKFNASKRAFMLASTLASGEGLNLQTCSDCVMHERQWNPANEEQAEARFIRIGQMSSFVNAVYVEAEETCDSHLDKLVSRKRIQFHQVMSENPNAGNITWNEGSLTKDIVAAIVESYNRKKAA